MILSGNSGSSEQQHCLIISYMIQKNTKRARVIELQDPSYLSPSLTFSTSKCNLYSWGYSDELHLEVCYCRSASQQQTADKQELSLWLQPKNHVQNVTVIHNLIEIHLAGLSTSFTLNKVSVSLLGMHQFWNSGLILMFKMINWLIADPDTDIQFVYFVLVVICSAFCARKKNTIVKNKWTSIGECILFTDKPIRVKKVNISCTDDKSVHPYSLPQLSIDGSKMTLTTYLSHVFWGPHLTGAVHDAGDRPLIVELNSQTNPPVTSVLLQ